MPKVATDKKKETGSDLSPEGRDSRKKAIQAIDALLEVVESVKKTLASLTSEVHVNIDAAKVRKLSEEKEFKLMPESEQQKDNKSSDEKREEK